MAEYIEREALEIELNHRLNFLMAENGEYDHYTSGFDECVSRVEDFPAADVVPIAKLEKTRRALAYMWFAYRNKDEEFTHDFERKAEKMAEKLLGKWEDCMSELLREENNGLS